MAVFNKVNVFVQDLAQKVHNLNTDAAFVALTNTAPTASTTTYTGLPGEVASGGGYTTGGMAVPGTISATQTAGTLAFKTTSNPVFTATTGFGPFRYVLLYNNTATGKNAIGWYDYGSAVTLAAAETFTVDLTTGVNILTLV
jgi:hypothetical protein